MRAQRALTIITHLAKMDLMPEAVFNSSESVSLSSLPLSVDSVIELTSKDALSKELASLNDAEANLGGPTSDLSIDR